MKQRNFTQNNIGLLGVHVCFSSLWVFVGTFLIAKVFTETDGNIFSVATLNISLFTAWASSFWVCSYLVKRFSRVFFLRASTVLLLVFSILIMLLENQISAVFVILAAVGGVAIGMFWAAMRTLECEINGGDGKNMAAFMLWYYIIISFSKIMFPFTIGAAIDFLSFLFASGVVVIIALVLFGFTLLINAPYKREPFSLLKFYKRIKQENKRAPVLLGTFSDFFWGFIGVISVVIPVIAMITLENNPNANFLLGISSSVFAAGAILLLAIYKRIKNKNTRNIILITTSVLPVILSLSILAQIGILAFLLISAGYGTMLIVGKMESSATLTNTMHKIDLPQFAPERNLLSEIFMYLGRLFALLLLLAVYFMPPPAFQWAVFALMLCNIPALVLILVLKGRYKL